MQETYLVVRPGSPGVYAKNNAPFVSEGLPPVSSQSLTGDGSPQERAEFNSWVRPSLGMADMTGCERMVGPLKFGYRLSKMPKPN